MRIVGICGRGLEGCGQTKYMIETKKALEYAGHTCDLIVSTDYNFVRKASHEITVAFEGKFADSKFVDKMIEETNKYDLAILFSLPDLKFTDECKAGFLKYIKALNIKMIYIVVDHNMDSIRRNACIDESCEKSDLILVHSLNGAMAQYVNSLGLNTPIDYLYTSRDFDEMRKQFWKPVSEMNLKASTFIGRCATWKKPSWYIEFSRQYLNPNGYISTMEGMEKSLAFTTIFYADRHGKDGGWVPGIDMSRYLHSKTTDYDNLTSEKMYVFGVYKFKDCMERLSKVGFGADLYTLDVKKYGKSLEQCHNDIVACGCIPIMSRHFGRNCLTLENKPWIEACPEVIWLDESNFEECFNKMEMYRKDPVLFDETREKIYEFFKTQGDISIISKKFDEIVNRVASTDSVKRKIKTQMKLW